MIIELTFEEIGAAVDFDMRFLGDGYYDDV